MARVVLPSTKCAYALPEAFRDATLRSVWEAADVCMRALPLPPGTVREDLTGTVNVCGRPDWNRSYWRSFVFALLSPFPCRVVVATDVRSPTTPWAVLLLDLSPEYVLTRLKGEEIKPAERFRGLQFVEEVEEAQ